VTSAIVINAILWIAASALLAAVLHAPIRLLDDRPAEVVGTERFELAEAA
jgi:hypothetical protein